MAEDPEHWDRREAARRAGDSLRSWLPVVLSIVSTILTIGLIYGRLGGRLDLIEYRLMQIERRIDTARP